MFDMRFPGQRYDSATGFNQNYFRDYDPGTGRYGQSDRIGLARGVNTFAYAGGNPVSSIDLFGLAPGDRYKTIDGAAAAAVSDANTLTRRSGFEYGGRLKLLPGGGYTYTSPVTDGDKFQVTLQPMQKDFVGDYHSHGNYYKYSDGRSVNPELFSEPGDYDSAIDDARLAASFGNPYFSYLGTPTGVIKRFNPVTGNIRNVPYPSPGDKYDCESGK